MKVSVSIRVVDPGMPLEEFSKLVDTMPTTSRPAGTLVRPGFAPDFSLWELEQRASDIHSLPGFLLDFIARHRPALEIMRDAKIEHRSLCVAIYWDGDQSMDISVPPRLCRELLDLDLLLDSEAYRFPPVGW